MTRKDYILIAEALKAEFDELVVHEHKEGTSFAAHAIATALESDNPRFDRERFLKACGVQS